MKVLTSSLPVVLAMLILSTATAAARRADLSEFAGNYRGSVSLNVFGTPASGPATVRVTVPRNGEFAIFRTSGSITSGGSTVGVNNTLVFLRPKALILTNLLFGIGGFAPGQSGAFTSRPHLLKYNTPFAIGSITGSLGGSIRAKKVGHKLKLIMSNLVAISGSSSVEIDFVVSRHLH